MVHLCSIIFLIVVVIILPRIRLVINLKTYFVVVKFTQDVNRFSRAFKHSYTLKRHEKNISCRFKLDSYSYMSIT